MPWDVEIIVIRSRRIQRHPWDKRGVPDQSFPRCLSPWQTPQFPQPQNMVYSLKADGVFYLFLTQIWIKVLYAYIFCVISLSIGTIFYSLFFLWCNNNVAYETVRLKLGLEPKYQASNFAKTYDIPNEIIPLFQHLMKLRFLMSYHRKKISERQSDR